MSPLTASCSSDDNLVSDQEGGVESQDLVLLVHPNFDRVLLCSGEDRFVSAVSERKLILSRASEALKMSSLRKTSLFL